MREETEKEILTKNTIQKELKGIYIFNILAMLVALVVLLTASLFLIFVIIGDDGGMADYIKTLSPAADIIQIGCMILFTIILVLVFTFLTFSVISFAKLLFAVKDNKFEIVTDKLTDLSRIMSNKKLSEFYSEETSELGKRPFVYVLPKIETQVLRNNYFYKLCFEKYKEYFLPCGRLYSWSQINSMNDWQIFRSADIGDEFYLVTAKDKVLYVYNTKHFELQE